ncbi:hypothetical protein QW131_19715 [Roseibium salinum]|nr:hypothetical protein [Roseibium salinum]
MFLFFWSYEDQKNYGSKAYLAKKYFKTGVKIRNMSAVDFPAKKTALVCAGSGFNFFCALSTTHGPCSSSRGEQFDEFPKKTLKASLLGVSLAVIAATGASAKKPGLLLRRVS